MSDILVRGLDRRVLDRLKERAKRHGRSLQGEAKRILEGAARTESIEATLAELRKFRESMPPSKTDATDLIREDRQR
jgi:antitoxin FitA